MPRWVNAPTLLLIYSVSMVLMSFSIMFLITNCRNSEIRDYGTRGLPVSPIGRASRSFILCQSLVVVWLIGRLIEDMSETLWEQTLGINIYSFAICFLGPCLLFFSLGFTRGNRRISPIMKGLLLMPGMILYVLFLASKEGFYFTRYEFGTYYAHKAAGFYILVGVIYCYIVAFLLLMLANKKTHREQRCQAGLMALAVALPLAVHVVSLVCLERDLTPLSFSLSAILTLTALTQYGFMDAAPIKRHESVHGPDDSLLKEQTEIARRLHDTIGHDLTKIMILAQQIVWDTESQSGEDPCETAGSILSLSRRLLENVRGCLRKYDDENAGIVERLESLVQRLSFDAVPIELSINQEGEERAVHFFAAETIFRVVRETVTNALRHGQADRVSVMVRFLAEGMRVSVLDNGRGCENINKRMGLAGMERAVRNLGGQIQFTSGEGEGFTVMVAIPVREPESAKEKGRELNND